ncbi:MAG TPA: MATE family efflux transporter [Candidatus Latescibacteria bacterium]|nr:MATE family efflux transporter [Candidatus Latescibacterota bacterium]HJP33918.1 MATE family efflux transporter [Candidatus Latescibacterota bacterium]
MTHSLRARWSAPGGYREFLVIAFPMILSTATWSVQHFIDRVFLTWYSTDALAASLPAGMTNFVIVSLFLGTAGYVNTFVAQYVGAGRNERVGPSLWQGVYLSVISGGAGFVVALLATSIFRLVGHDAAVQAYEVPYFRILCYGIGPLILSTALSCFYSGRGRTWPVLGVSVVAMSFNVVIDYALIFGHWGAPEMGIQGAAWATNIATVLATLIYILLLSRPSYRRQFAIFSGWRLDRDLFGRLLRFGGPSGVNFMLDILAFTFFILIVGRIGRLELTATNLAFNINSLAFMPLIGAGIALSTMVGQRLGGDDPEAAAFCTWTGVHVALGYMSIMALAYTFLPDLFLMPYGVGAQGEEFVAARDLARVLLRFVAFYCVFDAAYMMFTAALKGAGDTRYVMVASVVLGMSIMVTPPLIAVEFFDASVFVVWIFICAYLATAALAFYLRFRGGKWQSMRVIEAAPEPGIEDPPRVAGAEVVI